MKNGLVESANGDKEWYLNDKLHRTDGPAIEWAGDKEWWLHRVDGPAVIGAGGSKFWHLNGKRHRIDGPACEWANGSKSWWVDGIEYTSKSKYAKAIADYKFEQEDKLI